MTATAAQEHLQPGFDFTEGLTPVEMLHRLKEFAMYGLDDCSEVEQLVKTLETELRKSHIYQ